MDGKGERPGLAPVGGGAPGKHSWLVPSDTPVSIEFSSPGYKTWYCPGTRALRKARRQNRFVEQYLTLRRPLPTDLPDSYCLGGEEEAIICLTYLSGARADHPLSTGWLWKQLGFRPGSAPPAQDRLF